MKGITMSKGYKILAALFAAVMVFAVVVSIIAAVSNAETDRFLEEVDLFLEQHEQKTKQEPVYVTEPQTARMAAAMEEKPVYTWNQEMMGKVVAFEVGYCCKQCQYYVASACINRFYDWYDRDVIAMITDNNGEYYMMNPDYVWMDECNGADFWAMYEEIMPVVDRATYSPLNCYYWDNADTQRGWATLVWHCEKDGCYFYR